LAVLPLSVPPLAVLPLAALPLPGFVLPLAALPLHGSVLPLAALPLPGSMLLARVARLPDDVIRKHLIPFLGCGFESRRMKAEERNSDIADVKRQIANCGGCCNAGSHKDSTGACVQCMPGKYAGRSGAEICKVCPAGTWTAEKGAEYCEDCTKGKFLDDDGVYVKKHNEEKDCRECEGDTYAPVWGSAECRLCPTGKYILDDDIVRNSASDCEYDPERPQGGSDAASGEVVLKFSGLGAIVLILLAIIFFMC
ncbi:hypothetical protein TeGR_g2512, partial [Tetraparma gracilis]